MTGVKKQQAKIRRKLRGSFAAVSMRWWGLARYPAPDTCQREALAQQLAPLIALSPIAQQAFAWAARNGLEIRITPDLEASYTGSYIHGGAIKIPSDYIDRKPVDILCTLVHEIRHAWQYEQGLFYSVAQRKFRDASTDYLHTALYEADADAHGRAARAQVLGDTDESGALLRHFFSEWQKEKALPYMAAAMSRLRTDCNDYKTLLQYEEGSRLVRDKANTLREQKREGRLPDVFAPDYLDRLGRCFDGRNYINRAFKAVLRKDMLTPDAARRAFGYASADARALFIKFDLYRRQLRRQLDMASHPATGMGITMREMRSRG